MKKNSIIKNTAWIISCKVIQSILSLVISMLTARYLGPSNYGLINYATSVVAFFAPFMKLGFNHILVNEIINDNKKEGEILGTAIISNTLSSIACIIGVISFVYIANPNEPTTVIVCGLYSLNLIAQALEMIQFWYQANLISHYTSIVGLCAYVIVSGYRIFLLITQKSIYWFSVSQALDYLIIALILLIIYACLKRQKFRFSFSRFKSMFSKSRYFIISSLMITIFSQTDKIMLKAMLGDSEVGIYSAAVTCASMTGFIFIAIIDSFRPVIFEKKKNSLSAYENSITICYSVVIFISLIQSIIFTIAAPLAINILYGNEFKASIPVLQIVVWYTTFSYAGSVRDIWILSEVKQRFLWVINLSGALLNVLLNIIFIPATGAIGAAIASLITQIFSNVIIGFIIKPIRHNNTLMLKGCNPKYVFQYITSIINKRINKS